MEQKLKLRKHTSHFAPHTSSKGITLIALVVTIIVMLILAGVVINMVLGDDGIIARAEDSKKEQIEKEDMEAIKLAVSGQDVLTIAEFEPAGYDKAEKIQEELAKKYGNGVRVETSGDGYKITINAEEGRIYEINSAKQIAKIEQPGGTSNPTTQATATTAVTATPTATTTVTQSPTPIATPTTNNQTSITNLPAGTYVNYIDNNGNEIPCVILYDTAYNTANGTNYGIQAITSEPVTQVTLGSSDAEEAIISYNNAIETLNNSTMNYLNTDLATDARCVGSRPSDKNSEGEERDSTYWLDCGTSHGIFKEDDENYEEDYAQITALQIFETMGGNWMASRSGDINPDYHRFAIRCLNNVIYDFDDGVALFYLDCGEEYIWDPFSSCGRFYYFSSYFMWINSCFYT